jgi:hypothetical protein
VGSNFFEGFSLKNDVQIPFFLKTACDPLKFYKPFLKLPIFWLGIFEIKSEIVPSQMIGNFFGKREIIFFKIFSGSISAQKLKVLRK